MKKFYVCILCFLIMISLVISASAVFSVPTPVIEATESVVRILTEYTDGYATGSGFVIKSDKEETLIATNHHVIEGDPYSISVWISENETVSATILAQTSQKDMCVLKLAYPVTLKHLNLAKTEANQGDAVYAVGFPSAADYLSDKEAHSSSDATITNGIVSAVREATVSSYGSPTKILQINAAINSGNSGGPLFNENGEVVGINTYGINDSQGIFGAIAVSELKTFLVDNSIITSNNSSNILSLIVAFAAVIAVVVTIVFVFKRKRKMKRTSKSTASILSLREYMAEHPSGIGANDAVAMLLPVALHLRDLHNNGNVHLQVSPDSIKIGANGAFISNATSVEADRYVSGYTAPEVYKGSSAGNLSDIYSFCAVLYYVATGKRPMNSLTRIDVQQEEYVSNQIDTAFSEILETGMALDATNRFVSMQDVILKLSPFNVKPFIYTSVSAITTPTEVPKQKKGKQSTRISVFAIILTLDIALVATYFGCFFGAQAAAKQGNFETADNLLVIPIVTRLHSRELVTYVEAGQSMAARDYDNAKIAFSSISGYMNADELMMEADYRHAAQYADANQFKEAEAIYESLGKYKDSQKKLNETKYRRGIYLLYEEQKYHDAYQLFSYLSRNGHQDADQMLQETQYLWAGTLIEDEDYVGAYKKLTNIKNYLDTKEVLRALEEIIYAEGQRLYYDKNYAEAKTWFGCISSYLDSQKYLVLIEAYTSNSIFVLDDTYESLMDIFYFEDASTLLLSSQAMGERFLLGTWRGDGYYFTMNREGRISYDLPCFDYGDFYTIKDGTICLYPEEDPSNTRDLFFIEAVDPNCIDIYCYKNGKTYTLYR